MLRRLRFRVTVNTDNRLMSGVTLGGELQTLHELLGLSLAQIRQMQRQAVDASFMPEAARSAAAAALAATPAPGR